MTFYDNTGTALSSQPTWDLLVGSVSTQADVYQISFVSPAGEYTAVIDVPGSNQVSPAAVRGFGENTSLDAVYATIVQTSGTQIAPTTTSDSITIYQDDSISADMVITESALAAIGASSLADGVTVEAEMKLDSTNATSAPDVTGFTTTVISDTSGNRLINVSLDAFPAVFNVSGSAGSNVNGRLDLRLTKGSKTLISSVIDVSVAWAAAAGS